MKKYIGDLSEKAIENVTRVAIDTETMGLNLMRDRLCVVQLNIEYKNKKQETHIVHFPTVKDYSKARFLKKLLNNKNIIKIFHFARFDILAISKYLKVFCKNVVCTKILSKICRTYTDKHGLVDLVRNLMDFNLNKQMQCSDWGQGELTDQQYSYAENDVKYLFVLFDKLKEQAERDKKWNIAKKIFSMLPVCNFLEHNLYNPLELLAFDLKHCKY